MINDFHFSHEFLSCDSLNVSVVNDAILDGWLNYGCLIAPKSKLADYREWLDLQDAKFSKKWSNAFTYNLNDDMTGVYKSVAELEELDKCFDYIDAINVPTLIINEGELKVLEIDSGRHERNSAEVVNINNFNESSSFKKSKELKNQGILEGEDINIIWSERFAALANRTKKITIIDRYFSKNLEEDIGTRTTSIERFIDFLSQTGKKYSIYIYSSGDNKNSDRHNTISNYVDKTLSKRPSFVAAISYFEVNSCDDELFQRKAHDRFIQFDSFTIQLGSGMAIFRSYSLNACTFSFYRTATDPIFTKAHSTMWKRCVWRHTA